MTGPAGWLFAADPPPESIRGWADEIAARSEFQPPPRSLLQRALDGLGELLEWLSRPLSNVGGGGIYGLVAWAVLVGATVVLVWGLVRLFGRWDLGGRRRADHPVTVAVAPDESHSAVEWRRRADAAEAAGALDEAVRCWWRALVAELDDRGALDEHPAGTAGEYRGVVAAGSGPDGERFGRATDVFEPVWYGGRRPDRAEVEIVRAASDATTGSR